MQLHYIYSDKRAVRAAKITLNGQPQANCVVANDEKGYIIRHTFKDGRISGRTPAIYGVVTIELPAGVKGGPYKTRIVDGQAQG